MIFAFVIQQYNLMVYLDFSLIGSDPKVSHLLAVIAMSIAEEGKGFWQWGGSFETDSVDYSVKRRKILINLLNFIREKCFDIKNLASTIFFLQNQVPFFGCLLLGMTIVPEEIRSVNV